MNEYPKKLLEEKSLENLSTEQAEELIRALMDRYMQDYTIEYLYDESIY